MNKDPASWSRVNIDEVIGELLRAGRISPNDARRLEGQVQTLAMQAEYWRQQAIAHFHPPAPHGCVCPPTSEQTCKGPLCPRRAIGAAGFVTTEGAVKAVAVKPTGPMTYTVRSGDGPWPTFRK